MKVPVHVMVGRLPGPPRPADLHVVGTSYGFVLNVEDGSGSLMRVLVTAQDGRWLALAVASLSGAKDGPASFPGAPSASEGDLEPGSLGYGPVSSGCEEGDAPSGYGSPPKTVSGGESPPSSLLDATRRSDSKRDVFASRVAESSPKSGTRRVR